MTDPFRHDDADADAVPTGSDSSATADVGSMSFEVALAELESIVERLERGQLDLEASIKAYERGTELKRHCEARLKEAELRVERITLGPDGQATTSPFDVDEGR